MEGCGRLAAGQVHLPLELERAVGDGQVGGSDVHDYLLAGDAGVGPTSLVDGPAERSSGDGPGWLLPRWGWEPPATALGWAVEPSVVMLLLTRPLSAHAVKYGAALAGAGPAAVASGSAAAPLCAGALSTDVCAVTGMAVPVPLAESGTASDQPLGLVRPTIRHHPYLLVWIPSSTQGLDRILHRVGIAADCHHSHSPVGSQVGGLYSF